VNPLRQILKHVKCLEADVESIDLGERRVTLTYGAARREREMSYDHLVIALGSETNFFKLPGVEERALTMKSLGDAFLLRSHTLAMLEMASLTEDAPAQRAMLTFVVAGGGFAGVETIGALNDLVRDALEHYPGLREDDLRLILVHPGEVILPELGDSLGRYAQAKLARRNVEIRLQTRVTAFSDRGVELENGEAIPAQILVWTAGVTPSSVLRSLPCKKEKGRIVVDETLEVPGFPGVWAVGDCAWVPNAQTGTAHPPTAQHALRESSRCAKNIVAAIRGTRKKAFAFTTLGQLASIGHRTGVAKIMGLHFSGLLAWWLWRSIYLAKLPRLEKKLRVALRWSLDLLFSRDLTQYVTMRGIEREQRRLDYIRQHQAIPAPVARTLPAVATPGRQSGNGDLRL
jgi:NADH dehydrogenase